MTSQVTRDVTGPSGSPLREVCGLCGKPFWDRIDACFDVHIRMWMVHPRPGRTDPFAVGSALACRMSTQLVDAACRLHDFESFQCRIILASTRGDLRICFADAKLKPTENDLDLIVAARGMKTPDETWCVCRMRSWMQHAVRIPRDDANKWPLNGAEFVKIRTRTELCRVLACRGLVLMPEDLDAIENTHKFRQCEFDLPDSDGYACLPYFTQDICGLSPEVLMEHVCTWLSVFPAERSVTGIAAFEKCGLSGEAFVTMPNDELETMLTGSGMSSDIIKHVCKIRQTRSWGPNHSAPIPDGELVAPAIRAYHRQRSASFVEYNADLKDLHRAEFSIAPITKENAQQWRRVSEGMLAGDMEAIELMLLHAIGKIVPYLTYKEIHGNYRLASTRMSYFLSHAPTDMSPDVLNTTPLSNWLTPKMQGQVNTWTPSVVSEWLSRRVEATDNRKFTPVLSVLAGKELFALTPNQFGVRLVIDGASRMSMLRIVGAIMDNIWR
jgi:hypothetical protein